MIYFNPKENLAPNENEVRVMTSNILAVGPGFETKMTQEERTISLCEHYLAYLPDFIGLQEMQLHMQPVIEEKLNGVYKLLEMETNGLKNCTPLLYREDKYEPIESKYTSFFEGGLWNYVWAVYRRKSDSKKIAHMNLHYYFTDSELRTEEARLVNAELKMIESKYPDAAIFVTGDYNSTIDTPEHAAMLEGLQMKSGMLLTDDNDGYETTWHQPDTPNYEGDGAIDHICVTYNKVKVLKHRKLKSELLMYSTDHDIVFIDTEIL